MHVNKFVECTRALGKLPFEFPPCIRRLSLFIGLSLDDAPIVDKSADLHQLNRVRLYSSIVRHMLFSHQWF